MERAVFDSVQQAIAVSTGITDEDVGLIDGGMVGGA